ncbi:MAG TPA: hypothetical protein VJ602_10135 [Paludibacter sp.]|nr:hypothetical protein [Paludibacter sp.]
MAKKSIRKSLSTILQSGSILSANIKLNAATINRYGIDVDTFTIAMDADLKKADELDRKQKRLIAEQKANTLELNEVLAKIEKDYALAKKTVKLAEPQAMWTSYGIHDKK